MHLFVSNRPLPMEELLQEYIKRTGNDVLLNSITEYPDAIQKDAIEIRRDTNGKPYFPQIPQIRFSISHSGGFWACVFHEKEVGLDIEDPTIRRMTIPLDRLAKRYFSLEEQQFYEGKGLEAFLKVWTRKEAYLKCVGTGIARGLSSISTVSDGKWKTNINEDRKSVV